MINDYRVVVEIDRESLQIMVKGLILGGWQPFGGIATSDHNGTTLYSQAMVKYSDVAQYTIYEEDRPDGKFLRVFRGVINP